MAAVHGAGVALLGAEQQFAVEKPHVPVARRGRVFPGRANDLPAADVGGGAVEVAS